MLSFLSYFHGLLSNLILLKKKYKNIRQCKILPTNLMIKLCHAWMVPLSGFRLVTVKRHIEKQMLT